jgi:hypothetical protein
VTQPGTSPLPSRAPQAQGQRPRKANGADLSKLEMASKKGAAAPASPPPSAAITAAAAAAAAPFSGGVPGPAGARAGERLQLLHQLTAAASQPGAAAAGLTPELVGRYMVAPPQQGQQQRPWEDEAELAAMLRMLPSQPGMAAAAAVIMSETLRAAGLGSGG